MIFSINAWKTFDKIEYPFIVKALKKLRKERMYLSIITAIYGKPIANILLKRKDKTIFSKVRNKKGCPLSLLLLNIALEFLASSIRQ
jgi:hypothetical protein